MLEKAKKLILIHRSSPVYLRIERALTKKQKVTWDSVTKKIVCKPEAYLIRNLYQMKTIRHLLTTKLKK
jgi:hypothetical protein